MGTAGLGFQIQSSNLYLVLCGESSSDNFGISSNVISDMRLVADWFDAFSCVFIPVCYCMFT